MLSLLAACAASVLSPPEGLGPFFEPAPQDPVVVQAVAIDPRLPHTTRPTRQSPMTIRVVDGRSGMPVPGAQVYCIDEPADPVRGATATVHHVRADRLGFARLDENYGYWLLIEAEGYAPSMAMQGGWYDHIARVVPGIDVPLALRNYCDQPVTQGRIGLCLGCGHTPDIRIGRPGPDGVAWLRGIDPATTFDEASGFLDLYPLAPGMDGDYDDFSWQPGDAPAVVRRPHAFDVAGRVIDQHGHPAKGLVARQFGRHRGPATRTDEDGYFRLVSPIQGAWISLHYPGVRQPLLDAVMPRALPLTLHLADLEFYNRDAAPPEDLHPIALRCIDEATGKGLAGLSVTATTERPMGDSASHSQTTDAEGRVQFELPAGRAVFMAGGLRPVDGQPTATGYDYRELAGLVSSDAKAHAEVMELPLRAQGTCRFEIRGLPESHWVSVATIDGDVRATAGPLEVAVSRATQTALRIEAEGLTLSWPLTAGGPITLYWPEPTVLEGRIVDAQGRAVAADVGFADPRSTTDAEGRFRLTTRLSGHHDLEVVPADPSLAGVVLRVELPSFTARWKGTEPTASTTVTLDPVALATVENAALRLLDASGEPLDERTVWLVRPGLAKEVVVRAGAWEDIPPRAGDWILVEPEDAAREHTVRRRVQLEGDGPWTVRECATSLEIALQSAAGNPLRGSHIYAADRIFVAKDKTFELRGMAPGTHTLIVSHPTHGAGSVEVEVSTASRTIVRLPR